MERLSDAMKDALALAPVRWARPPRNFKFRGRTVRFPLFHPTFDALKARGLIEWRGGPDGWEWRLTSESAKSPWMEIPAGYRWDRTDGACVTRPMRITPQMKRPWIARLPDGKELKARGNGFVAGNTRTFATAEAAMRAVDEACPAGDAQGSSSHG